MEALELGLSGGDLLIDFRGFLLKALDFFGYSIACLLQLLQLRRKGRPDIIVGQGNFCYEAELSLVIYFLSADSSCRAAIRADVANYSAPAKVEVDGSVKNFSP
jgi:hypothetical protein